MFLCRHAPAQRHGVYNTSTNTFIFSILYRPSQARMLKNFFISMLGAIAGFWISLMLFMVSCMILLAGSLATSLVNSEVNSAEIKDNSILRISFDANIEERGGSLSFEEVLQDVPAPMTLENILRAISAAKEDKHIAGIYLDCKGGSGGIATMQAIQKALADFQKSGKWVCAYSDNYTQGNYYIASGAKYLYLNPVGSVDVRGLGSQIPFFKNLLDKLGVKMQIFKVGTYKSAVEPFILTEMSPASREMTDYFLKNIWNNMSTTIAQNRKVPVATVNQWADSLSVFNAPETYVKAKMVDKLLYANELTDHLKKITKTKKDDDLNFIDYNVYLASAKVPHEKSNKNKIAVLYACGDIVDTGDKGISAEKMVPEILALAEDDDIKAMVLRVNSGGGSAFASEQIWHALEVFKQNGKTLYVSMGDYAASGGYYISCGADRIFAEPSTLTGSIGIFGMIPDIQGLLNDKIGINLSTVTTNANGDFPTITKAVTPYQTAKMQETIARGYDLFTKRCAQGRNIPQDSIKAIGEGRVWDGVTAKRIGLVDNLGGLQTAIRSLAKKMKYDNYQVVTYPNVEKNFWDMLAEMPMQAKTAAMKDELGTFYPVYLEMKRLEGFNPIQARMLPVTMQ